MFFRILRKRAIQEKKIKIESIRKLSNFNFQWTKTLYQNNFKRTESFFTFFWAYRSIKLYEIPQKKRFVQPGPGAYKTNQILH